MADLKAKLSAKLKALDEMEDMLDRVDADAIKGMKPSDAVSDDPAATGQDKSPPENGEDPSLADKDSDENSGSGDTDAEDFDENSDSLPVRQMAAMKKAANRGAGGGRPTKLSK